MKLIKAIWQCEECGGTVEEDTIHLHECKNYVSVCIDFGQKANPWISVCPSCIERLEKAWPKLVAKFRELAKKG
jgi:hypothetical protein